MNYRPSEIPPSGEPKGAAQTPFSGHNELASARLGGNLQAPFAGSAEVSQAHQLFPGRMEAGFVPHSALSGGFESTALSSAQAAANQQISPLLQMIMRMPGHIGLLSSFFEVLGKFFTPATDLLHGFDFTHLAAHAHAAAQSVVGAAGEHLPIDLSLLPADAPFLQGLHNEALLHGQSLATHGIDAVSRNSMNVSGVLDPGKPLFEAGGLSKLAAKAPSYSTGSEHLSGPSMSNSVSGHLAGNHRLFGEQIDRATAGSISLSSSAGVSSLNVPVTSLPSSLNVGASPFGTEVSSLQSVAQVKDGLLSGPSMSQNAGFHLGAAGQPNLDSTANLGPSGGVSDQLGGKSLLASDTGSVTNPGSNLGATGQDTIAQVGRAPDPAFGRPESVVPKEAAPAMEGLRAKALSLSGSKLVQGAQASVKSAASHAGQHVKNMLGQLKTPAAGQHSVIDQISHVNSSSPSSGGHPSMDQIAHLKPHSSGSAAVRHPGVDQIAHRSTDKLGHHSDAHVSHRPSTADKISQVPKAVNDASGQSGAPLSDATYTIRSGDCLWNIARDHLGSGARWHDIYNLNRDLLGANPGLIRPGTTIHLPGASDGLASSGLDASKYVVQPGDNLWNIAKTHMGGGQHWGDIYKLNSGVIGSNPSLIHPGQQLNLPTDASHVAAQPAATTMPSATGGTSMAPQSMSSQSSPLSSLEVPAGQPVLPSNLPETSMLPAAGAAQSAPPISANSSNAIVPASLKPDLSYFNSKSTQ